MTKFKDRLKKLRQDARMTQKDLGKVLGVSPSAIGMYEQGSRTPDFDTLMKIADHFNVSTDYLIGRIQNVCTESDMEILLNAKNDLSDTDLKYVIMLIKRLKRD